MSAKIDFVSTVRTLETGLFGLHSDRLRGGYVSLSFCWFYYGRASMADGELVRIAQRGAVFIDD